MRPRRLLGRCTSFKSTGNGSFSTAAFIKAVARTRGLLLLPGFWFVAVVVWGRRVTAIDARKREIRKGWEFLTPFGGRRVASLDDFRSVAIDRQPRYYESRLPFVAPDYYVCRVRLEGPARTLALPDQRHYSEAWWLAAQVARFVNFELRDRTGAGAAENPAESSKL